MKSKPESRISGGEGQFTLNDTNRFSVPKTNRISNSNNDPLPETNGNSTNIEQRVDNIENKVDQALDILKAMGGQPAPHPQPQAPPVTEVTEDPDVVRRSRRIVD